MQKALAAAILGWATLLAAAPASAEPVGFEFTGTVIYSTYMAPLGSRITGQFSYDPETLPSANAQRRQDQVSGYVHYHLPPPHRMTAQVNGHTIEGSPPRVDVWNNVGGNTGDMIDIAGGYPMVLDGTSFTDGSLGFRLASGFAATDPLSSTDLPRHFRVEEFVDMNYGWIQMDGGQSGTLLQFRVDSIRRSAPTTR